MALVLRSSSPPPHPSTVGLSFFSFQGLNIWRSAAKIGGGEHSKIKEEEENKRGRKTSNFDKLAGAWIERHKKLIPPMKRSLWMEQSRAGRTISPSHAHTRSGIFFLSKRWVSEKVKWIYVTRRKQIVYPVKFSNTSSSSLIDDGSISALSPISFNLTLLQFNQLKCVDKWCPYEERRFICRKEEGT